MKTPARDRRLRTVQRLRELELETARTERARLDSAAEEQRRQLEQLQEGARDTTRIAADLSNQGVAADTLRQVRYYAAWQNQCISRQETELETARNRAEAARQTVIRRLERLRIVERLRERVARVATEAHVHMQYVLLDDQGIVSGNFRNRE
jgi:flagellar export protein FliJ